MRLIIFLGGSDLENETGKVVAGIKLSRKNWRHIDVVVGQNFPAPRALADSLKILKQATLHVQTRNIAELMAAADLAVTAGGSITWEKCALGLPSLVTILADNQRAIARSMHEWGAQRTLGIAANLTPECYGKIFDESGSLDLSAMIERASAICDGSGTRSVVKVLEHIS
jgi:UDP-2,4-diacetamido-2,4,6-trideoxy-beta-L-altropyranose hydrolase